jgi:predicted RecA/RadA family phage recombinase
MALTADAPRVYELGNINELPVAASTTIYEGAAVGDNGSGYARGLVAGDPFRGFAESQADNSAGSAGDIDVRLITEGKIKLTITGVGLDDVGQEIYASADGTFTLTAGSNTLIGFVYRYVTTNTAIVKFYLTEGDDLDT